VPTPKAARAGKVARHGQGPIPDVAYYATGAVQSRGHTLDGAMHGAWEFFRKDGSVMRTGEFDRGKQVGVWRTFDRDGRLVRETKFSNRAG
jgi:antitoxin component YwqK of YwqJK toxin-antitoxin module